MRLIACYHYDYECGGWRVTLTPIEENVELSEHVDQFDDCIFFFVSPYEE